MEWVPPACTTSPLTLLCICNDNPATELLIIILTREIVLHNKQPGRNDLVPTVLGTWSVWMKYLSSEHWLHQVHFRCYLTSPLKILFWVFLHKLPFPDSPATLSLVLPGCVFPAVEHRWDSLIRMCQNKTRNQILRLDTRSCVPPLIYKPEGSGYKNCFSSLNHILAQIRMGHFCWLSIQHFRLKLNFNCHLLHTWHIVDSKI